MFTLTDKVTDSIGKRLLQAMLAELVMLSPRYNALTQEAQQEIIDRLRSQLEDEIGNAVHTIAAQSFETVPATIASVAFRDEVKATLTMNNNNGAGTGGIHALADRVGGACMVVLCDDAQFRVGMDAVKGQPNQHDLLQHGPGDDDDDDDDDDVTRG